MNNESKTIQLVTKLIKETKKGNITWQVCDAPRALTHDTEQSVPLFLKTEYKGKYLGVFDLRTKSFYDEHEFYWSESIGFCIVDDDDRVVWESNEYTPMLLSLFNLAREQASGLNDIFDDLLD